MLSALIALDERVFSFFHAWAQFLPGFWRFIAIYTIYFIPLFLIWFWFARGRQTALFATITGLFAWKGVNSVISAFIHRDRPIAIYDLHFPEKELFFDRPGPSFPSDHTAFLVALTSIFWLSGHKKVAKFLIVLTFVTVLARVVTAQHWPGDILGGMIVGLVTAWGFWVLHRPIEDYLVDPLVRFARKLGL